MKLAEDPLRPLNIVRIGCVYLARPVVAEAERLNLPLEIADVGLNDGKRETTDDEALVVIQKFVKNLKESIEHEDSYDKQVELQLYMSYLPRMLTEEELEVKIGEYITLGNGNVGMIMKELKASGHWYDGKQASAVAKRLLST